MDLMSIIFVNPNLFAFLGECAVILFCFAPLKNKDNSKAVAAGLLCLLINLFMYRTSGAGSGHSTVRKQLILFISRAVFHAAVVFMFLSFSKSLKLKSCLLLAMFYLGGYQFSLGVRLLVFSVDFGAGEMLRYVTSDAAVLLTQLLWAYIIRRILGISDLNSISYSRWGVIGTLTFMQTYIRWSLMPEMTGAAAPASWFKQIEYPLFAMAGLLLVEIFYEISISMQAKADSARMEKLSLQYELQNAKRQTQNSDDIRRIYHDMKNHLLAISTMTSSKAAHEYMDGLLERFEGYENNVRTGNTIVDAILTEKIILSQLDDISFNVCMDISELGFIEAVDIVAIFGNAVDNAVEAVRKLPDKEKRRIYIKSINNPGFVTLVFSNPYLSIEKDKAGNIVTAKKDRENHGIGLVSMRHAAEKYSGIISTDQNEEKHIFELTILIPLVS